MQSRQVSKKVQRVQGWHILIFVDIGFVLGGIKKLLEEIVLDLTKDVAKHDLKWKSDKENVTTKNLYVTCQ